MKLYIWNDMKLYQTVWKLHEVTWNDMKWSRSLWFSLPRFSLRMQSGSIFFCFFRSRTRSFGSGRVPTARTAAASSGGDANLSSWPARPRPWRPCWTLLHAGLSFEKISGHHDISGDHMRSWDILCLNKWGKKDVLWRFHVVPQLALRHLVSLSG